MLPENPPFAFEESFSNYYINLYVLEPSKEKYMNTKKETFNEFVKFVSARLFTYFVDLILIIILVDKMHFNSLLMKILVNISNNLK